MGLLKCPDCEKVFSDRIDACPNCACPKEAAIAEMNEEQEPWNSQATIDDPVSKLVQLGIALSEENRVHILKFIHKKGEVSVQDIRNKLNCSHTNAYYHISLLMQSNLLKVKNRGRALYYSINQDFVNEVCILLSEF